METREISVHIFETPDELPGLLLQRREGAGPFARMAFVVPSEALRHRIRAGCGDLAGVRFCSAADLAADVVVGEGIGRRAGAEQYAALTVEALLAGSALEGRLDYFRLEQLRSGAGYADAIARTITELSDAALTPADLRRAANRERDGDATPGRMLDLAAVWEALADQDRGAVERTRAELLREATGLTAADSGRAAAAGAVLAWISEQTPNTELQFLATLPNLTVLYQTARPVRPESTARLHYIAKLLGLPEGALADPAPARARAGAGELVRLQAELFLPPGAAGAEHGSDGPDGTVRLEEYAGVEDELAAAAEWVADQVRRGRPLEQLALLVPAADPYAMMTVERLAELPWDSAADPAYVDTGIPVAATPRGARLVAVLNALQDALSAEAMSRLLPYVRFELPGGTSTSVTFARAMELVWSCGTLGGLAGKPEGAADWSPAFARLEAELTLSLERANAAGEQEEDLAEARGGTPKHVLERRLATIRGLRPAVDSLVALHGLVLREHGVRDVWRELRAFVHTHILRADPVKLWPRLGRELDGFLDSTLSARVGGRPAVRIIREAVDTVRQGHGRFGEPRCYIGTIAGAAGLAFDAVRVLGLSEGAFPARPAVDPILPDTDRRGLEPGDTSGAVPRRDDRPWLDFRAFHRVMRGARKEVVLSVPRQGIDGSVREASGLLLEVAAALRRPIGPEGERSAVPTLSDLRRGYFGDPTQPAPLQLAPRAIAAAVAARPAPSEAVVPGAWLAHTGTPAADLARLRDLLDGGPPGAIDGLLGNGHPLPKDIGLTPAHAISASRLKTLLECPYRFLLERVLQWEEPAGAPESREIGQPHYGGLV
ncbi:MAG: PD-(D/E)XK nuclease family protein, partial [Planctomycetota bacterium]